MELDKSKEFTGVCDHEDVLQEAIRIYNQTYKTDFILKEMIYDEVDLARITGHEYKISDVFSLGSMYSRMSEKK